VENKQSQPDGGDDFEKKKKKQYSVLQRKTKCREKRLVAYNTAKHNNRLSDNQTVNRL
jgi:hypothetical protein